MFNIVSTLSGILMIAQKPAQSYIDSLEWKANSNRKFTPIWNHWSNVL